MARLGAIAAARTPARWRSGKARPHAPVPPHDTVLAPHHSDFGVDAFFVEAEHLSIQRLTRAIDEVLEVVAREFYDYRTAMTAPAPDPRAAFDTAISTVLAPLVHEQQTTACTAQVTAAAVEKAVAAALAKASPPQDGTAKKAAALAATELADMRRQLGELKRQRVDDAGGRGLNAAKELRFPGAAGSDTTRGGPDRPRGEDKDAPPIDYWTGVAKVIQNKIKSDTGCQHCKWPCMKLFLTGACGDPSCRICTSPGGLAGKGEPPTRKLAAAELSRLLASGRVSDTCKTVIAKGKSART